MKIMFHMSGVKYGNVQVSLWFALIAKFWLISEQMADIALALLNHSLDSYLVNLSPNVTVVQLIKFTV